ncbi:hypothetical protein SD77_0005 [Bacillus badius]|uniref:Uncharacterized protein n=1 Tax=Bacillus badius TaxID=1455 RepID=A0ABR5AZM2_BACBA|nr:hypothetical protein SD77_0005 [Bacillus badius]
MAYFKIYFVFIAICYIFIFNLFLEKNFPHLSYNNPYVKDKKAISLLNKTL